MEDSNEVMREETRENYWYKDKITKISDKKDKMEKDGRYNVLRLRRCF